MSRGNNPFWRGGGGKSKSKPLFSIPQGNSSINDDNLARTTGVLDVSFTTDLEPGSFVGWKLYFPEKSFKESPDIRRRVTAMEDHYKTYIHWYDTTEIEQLYKVTLNLGSLVKDKEFQLKWPDFREELKLKPAQTLACAGLAMHNVIVENADSEDQEDLQHRKIYTTLIGFEPRTKVEKVLQKSSELVSVTGHVIRMEPTLISPKMICFRCSLCNSEIVVKQNVEMRQATYPSSCPRCPSRGHFTEILGSPYTIYQSKQMISIQDSVLEKNRTPPTLLVELTQDNVESLVVGQEATFVGILKRKSENYAQKRESKTLVRYLKCVSLESKVSSSQEDTRSSDFEFITEMKAQPSPFRILVHSLCPAIYGRTVEKAGLVLGLLSGSGLLKNKRSESHILLVGSAGTGKSQLLQTCAEVSMKGFYVNGPTSTGVGLTASIGANGTVEAGALLIANDGACAIDEFDKMKSHQHVLLESMEQQTVSILKSNVCVNYPSNVVIIAAANPKGSFYEKNKTLLENVSIPTPMLSRFDLIFPLEAQSNNSDEKFIAHMIVKGSVNQSKDSGFFNTPSTSGQRDSLNWIKSEPDEQLPFELVKRLIAHARENVFPKLSQEAIIEIHKFFLELRKLTVGADVQPITYRQLEALMRLTLARARGDLKDVATREHALDVIFIFKKTMIDIYAPDDPLDASLLVAGGVKRKAQVQNLSSLSILKQVRAFLEHLESEVESRSSSEFTSSELKVLAKELGVTKYDEIIHRLNSEAMILKTVEGYKFVG